MTTSTTAFRRYTDLASLLDMLRGGAITLLRPDTWDDRNERLMMKTYADRLGTEDAAGPVPDEPRRDLSPLEGLHGQEQRHPYPLRRNDFKQAMRAAGVKVKYLKLDQLVANDRPIETLPLLKRRFGAGKLPASSSRSTLC